MNLTLYEYFLLLTPFILFHFCLDYLSDEEVTHSETKIGILQMFHHTIGMMVTFSLILPFLSSRLSVLIAHIIVALYIQIGHLINKDYCWLTTMVNEIIDPKKPNRKWTGTTIWSLLKKFTRGPEWAYSEIRKPNNLFNIVFFNCMYILLLVKMIFSKKILW